MSSFESVEEKPEDPILGLSLAFRNDPREKKVNLGVGAYKNAQGRPEVLSCVRKAEKALVEMNLDKEYLPVLGNPLFIDESLKLMFGESSPLFEKGCVAGAQTLGGTGALRLGGEFFARTGVSNTIYISDPSWLNHRPIFSKAGLEVRTYPYFDSEKGLLNLSAMLDAVEKMPEQSVVLLQTCCHNPTGFDLEREALEELSRIMKKRRLIPFFDCAYLGFGEGLEKDAEAMRYFALQGHEMLVAFSYSKNMGLYGERVGALAVVADSGPTLKKVLSQLKQIIRGNYSMPPLYGQRVAAMVLGNGELKEEWKKELGFMRERIQKMRNLLLQTLREKGVGQRFESFERQKGMFSYSGLDVDQVKRLLSEFGIYMPDNGRINVAGINESNVEYVAVAIKSVL